jgi:RimJ/RimL family protein N-acetyltransferase
LRLLNAYENREAEAILWRLLEEREPHQNISHRRMPTPEEHRAFIASRPYAAWYLIEVVTDCVDTVALITEIAGAVYLTRDNEIGVGILKRFRGFGYGREAVRALMAKHPNGRFLANINPANESSRAMFESLGFRHIQNTYEALSP